MKKYYFPIFLLLFMLVVIGCQKKEEPQNENKGAENQQQAENLGENPMDRFNENFDEAREHFGLG